MSDDEGLSDTGYAESTTTVSSYNRGASTGGSTPFCNIFFGLTLVFGGIYTIGWNERRTVCKNQGLLNAEEVFVTAKCDQPPTNYEGKLVLLSCPLQTENMPRYLAADLDVKYGNFNKVFGDVRGLCFNQEMKIFLCKESKTVKCVKHDGDGNCKKEKTEFRYDLDYSDQFVDSRDFYKDSKGDVVDSAKHAKQNECGTELNPKPNSFPFQLIASAARPDAVKMGKWLLDSEQVHRLTKNCDEVVAPKQAELQSFNQEQKQPIQAIKPDNVWADNLNNFYSCSLDAQSIGCIKLQFFTKAPKFVTLLYYIKNSSFSVYTTPPSWICSPDTLSHIQEGYISSDELFKMFQDHEYVFRWTFRLLGFITIYGGLYMFFSPIEWLAHHIPFCGNCIGGAIGCFLHAMEGLIAFGISLITISIMWIFMRPLIGITLLLFGLAFIGFSTFHTQKVHEKSDAKSKLLLLRHEGDIEMD